MLEHIVSIILGILIPLCELIGIFVVAVSAIGAFLHYLYGLIKGIDRSGHRDRFARPALVPDSF